jgi:hypothetical protein
MDFLKAFVDVLEGFDSFFSFGKPTFIIKGKSNQAWCHS